MKIDFWTDENFTTFWNFVKMLMETVAPGIMLVFSIVAVSLLIGVVFKAFRKADNEEDDFDYRRY